MALTFLSAHALASLCTLEPAGISATRAERCQPSADGRVPPGWAGPWGPWGLTHGVHIQEKPVLLLAGVQAFHCIHQGRVGVVEVRVGNEHRRIWGRLKAS